MKSHRLLAIIAIAWASATSLYAEDPKPGEERDFEIAKGVKMKFCWIPAGKTTLGPAKDENGRYVDEIEHEYEVKKGFWMAKFTVTQEQYVAVIGTNPSVFAKGENKKVYRDRVKGMDTSQFPVENVSWNDCQAFIKKCILKVRLPHEYEWEYAYRGGKGNKQPFYWGDSSNGNQTNCNGKEPYGTTVKGPYLERTTKVGSYEKAAPHPWGLCDMSGNVTQWCENLDARYEVNLRAHRGATWISYSKFCRAAMRMSSSPEDRNYSYGFRLCLDN